MNRDAITVAANRLQSFIRRHVSGQCRILNIGSECQCLLCDVSRLAGIAVLAWRWYGQPSHAADVRRVWMSLSGFSDEEISKGLVDTGGMVLADEIRQLEAASRMACSCPTIDGVQVTGSSCKVHGLPSADL
jgi:hypothetical protein